MDTCGWLRDRAARGVWQDLANGVRSGRAPAPGEAAGKSTCGVVERKDGMRESAGMGRGEVLRSHRAGDALDEQRRVRYLEVVAHVQVEREVRRRVEVARQAKRGVVCPWRC